MGDVGESSDTHSTKLLRKCMQHHYSLGDKFFRRDELAVNQQSNSAGLEDATKRLEEARAALLNMRADLLKLDAIVVSNEDELDSVHTLVNEHKYEGRIQVSTRIRQQERENLQSKGRQNGMDVML